MITRVSLQGNQGLQVGAPGILGVSISPAQAPGNDLNVNVPGLVGVQQARYTACSLQYAASPLDHHRRALVHCSEHHMIIDASLGSSWGYTSASHLTTST